MPMTTVQRLPDDNTKITEIDGQRRIFSVSFTGDGKQLWTGGEGGKLRRWRADDGHEIGEPIQTGGTAVCAIALSPDRKWLVCGLIGGDTNVGVWDAETHRKVLDIKSHAALSVDITPDSTKLATGSADNAAFIWDLMTGRQLVGPLQHDNWVVAVRFSPNGDRLATAIASKSICIYSSDNGERLLDIPFSVNKSPSSCLAWSCDGHQLFAVSNGGAKCFDTSSGRLLSNWSVPGQPNFVTLARSQKFIVISGSKSASFWDASTHEQLGTVIKHASRASVIALSPDDACIVTGGKNGKITLQSLYDILPDSYLTVDVSDQLGTAVESNRSRSIPRHSHCERVRSYISGFLIPPPFFKALRLPLISIDDVAFKSWIEGDLTHVEELLTKEILYPSNHLHQARALAHRALVRARSKQWSMVTEDAKKSIEIERSVIGHVACAIARVGNGEHESAIRAFDLVFSKSAPTENEFLLLIKAVLLFGCGKYDHAISRVDDLVEIVDDKAPYIAVRAQMFLLLGSMSLRAGDYRRATELLMRAQESVQFQTSPHLTVISLIFGWYFDRLAPAVWSQLQECIKPLEGSGDAALQSEDPKEAIIQYSTALSLGVSNPAGLLVRRSKAQAMLGSWNDALKDADEAIQADPTSPWGYERKHAALHGLQGYNEAIDTFTHMLSLIKDSADLGTRQLVNKYVSPAQSEMAIDGIARKIFETCPLVLIDVQSGCLCDAPKRMRIFKSEMQFKELVSSMTQQLDENRILLAVTEYFRYVMLSHVWRGMEPSYQDVNSVNSVWELPDSLPLNEKLRKFCEVVRRDGYRWAWSDTCCIDKTNSTVLNQSLTMMYKWYEASAATLVLLMCVGSPSVLGDLANDIWMTRAWTAQELLAPKVIRFYDRNWNPYLDDTRPNHKESPEIMQELADAIGLSRETITAFNPDNLSIQQKLRLVSTRRASVEEDVAYSLIGIFKSDIRPYYGEGEAALGHLLEEIVARSGNVAPLAWVGKSSRYNSCLPASLSVYSQPSCALPAIEDAEMKKCVSVSESDALQIYRQITRLPPARFANRRLHLPCIIFAVRRLGVQDFGNDQEHRYRAQVAGIGRVEFKTSDRLSLAEPRKFILVHPWLRDLRDPPDGFTLGSVSCDDGLDSDLESVAASTSAAPLDASPAARMDESTRAARLLIRLQRPFHALLLGQQPDGEFRRVAAEHEIVVQIPEGSLGDIRTDVVEIL